MVTIPPLILERLHRGEYTDEERKALEKKYGTAELAAALQQLADDDAAAGKRLPVETALADMQRRASMQHKSIRMTMISILSAAAAVIVAGVLFVPSLMNRQGISAEETVRLKGSNSIVLYRKQGGGQDILKNGTRAKAGDIVQVVIQTAEPCFGVVISIDGRNNVTLHQPAVPDGDTSLTAGEHRLPHAYRLDDAPRFEKFFFISSTRTLAPGAVVDLVKRALREGKDPETFVVKSVPGAGVRAFILIKE